LPHFILGAAMTVAFSSLWVLGVRYPGNTYSCWDDYTATGRMTAE